MDDRRYLRRCYLNHFIVEDRRPNKRLPLSHLRSIWRSASKSADLCLARPDAIEWATNYLKEISDRRKVTYW
jgi:hypothetical protein